MSHYPDPIKIADRLDNAANVLEQGHLIKGKVNDSKGGYCAIGAIEDKNEFHPYNMYARTALRKYLIKKYRYLAKMGAAQRDFKDQVAYWNDMPSRRKSHVVNAFRETAKELRNG